MAPHGRTDQVVHHLLLYNYVSDMAERRGEYREHHLKRIAAERDGGHIEFAGAFDSLSGAAIGSVACHH